LARISLENLPVPRLVSMACLLQGMLQPEDPQAGLLPPARVPSREAMVGRAAVTQVGALPQVAMASSARCRGPPAHVQLCPTHSSRSGVRRGDFCSLVSFSSVLCRGEIMRTMTRTKDDRCDQVKAILKRLVLNG